MRRRVRRRSCHCLVGECERKKEGGEGTNHDDDAAFVVSGDLDCDCAYPVSFDDGCCYEHADAEGAEAFAVCSFDGYELWSKIKIKMEWICVWGGTHADDGCFADV